MALLGAGATYVALSVTPAQPAADVAQRRVPPAAIESAPRASETVKEAPEVQGVAGVPVEQAIAPAAANDSARPARAPALARSERTRQAARTAQASELDLLHRAQAAWRSGQARSALGLLDEHRARFPRSALGVERDALRALSLCELGRDGEAKALARKVLAREPRSPLRAALQQSCAR
jgi:hypothetical protein